jgi:hypothetical protein
VVVTWVPHQGLLGLEWHQLILVAGVLANIGVPGT